MGGTMRLGLYPADLTPGLDRRRGVRREPGRGAAPPPLRGQQQVPRRPRGGRPGVLRADRPTASSSSSSSCRATCTPTTSRPRRTPSCARGRPGRTRCSAGWSPPRSMRQRELRLPVDESGLRACPSRRRRAPASDAATTRSPSRAGGCTTSARPGRWCSRRTLRRPDRDGVRRHGPRPDGEDVRPRGGRAPRARSPSWRSTSEDRVLRARASTATRWPSGSSSCRPDCSTSTGEDPLEAAAARAARRRPGCEAERWRALVDVYSVARASRTSGSTIYLAEGLSEAPAAGRLRGGARGGRHEPALGAAGRPGRRASSPARSRTG